MKVLLFKGRGFISRLIRWQTRGKYSHAAVLVDEANKTIYEAWQGSGVRAKTVTDWANIEMFDVPGMTKVQQNQVHLFLHEQIGKPYDYVGVLRFVTRRRKGDQAKWFCSELVFEAFKRAGIDLLARTKSWEVSPQLLSRSTRLVRA